MIYGDLQPLSILPGIKKNVITKHSPGNTSKEVMTVSFIGPQIKTQFESLPIDLKNVILQRNVRLVNLADLIRVLEEIVAEG